MLDLNRIKEKRKDLGIQLKPEQLHAICEQVVKKNACNFLVFGFGNDTSFWLEMNKNGRTVFLEDHKGWFEKVKQKHPSIEAYLIDYSTQLWQWKKLLNNHKELEMKLPEQINNTKWDVVLVDAPIGWIITKPGRMKSIFTASKLVKKGGHVFVHDCNRKVERVYSDKFLGRLVKEVGTLRHYNH